MTCFLIILKMERIEIEHMEWDSKTISGKVESQPKPCVTTFCFFIVMRFFTFFCFIFWGGGLFEMIF